MSDHDRCLVCAPLTESGGVMPREDVACRAK